MTLLWVTYVIHRETKRQDHALRVEAGDVAKEIRQASTELDELFRNRRMRRREGGEVAFVFGTGASDGLPEKSNHDRWSLAFKHHDQ